MALISGARLGVYEIVGPLGAGGMGEVYRARDTQLKRDVALKTLPSGMSRDADRLARLQREAEVLAALNHPNIAQIHGLADGQVSGVTVRALVMELVEGDDLAQRITGGAIPIPEVLTIARQIALALDYAHERGIVHRDLKPANIKVTPDGHVKVLDFGLAKAMEQGSGNGDQGSGGAADSPTLTSPAMTERGMILGTAAYMSPEQAKGKVVDKRSDIWAFGCVLYEMIIGKRAFDGEDVTDSIVAVMSRDPLWQALPPTTPPALRKLIRRCLEKDRSKRLADIRDALLEIDEAIANPEGAVDAASPATRRAAWLPWSVAVFAMLVAAAALAARSWFVVPVSDAVVRFDVEWPRQTQGGGSSGNNFFELSPDGRYFAIASDGVLWVRSVDQVRPVRIDHTEGAVYPFWSPDSQSVGFFADGDLKRGAWSPDGTIIFAANQGITGLSQVSSSGGAVTPVTAIANPRTSAGHRYPQFLPDGRRFLFLHLDGDRAVGGVYVGSLDGAPVTRVLDGSWRATFAPSDSSGAGYLLVVQDTALMAIPFDPVTLRVSGAPASVADRVSAAQNTGLGRFSVSRAGVLAHGELVRPGNDFSWFDAQGNRLSRVLPANPGNLQSVEFDRSERRAAMVISDWSGSMWDIWLSPEPGVPASRFASGSSGWNWPRWSPDGLTMAYATNNQIGLPAYEVRRKMVASPYREEVLLSGNEETVLWDWFPDGQALLIERGPDLWRLPLDAPRTPVRLTQSPEDERWAQVAPNGRWIAYATAEQGMDQVFVQSVSSMSERWLITPEGGTMPRWSRDGEALYYRAPDSRLRRVSVVGPRRLIGQAPLSIGRSSRWRCRYLRPPTTRGTPTILQRTGRVSSSWPRPKGDGHP